MNLENQQPPLLPPQPLRFTTCERHPDQTFTSFCASCLRERLAILEASTANSSSSSSTSAARTAASALKAIFQRTDKNKALGSSSSSSFLPELRRSKSFSGGKGEGFSGVLVPQRKSCDVRGRSSLWALFNQDNQRKVETWGEVEVEPRELGFSGVIDPLEEEEEEEEEDEEEEEIRVETEEDEIREPIPIVNVVEEIEVAKEEEEEKPMKDHIELDSHNKKPTGRDFKDIAGSFWVAASVFSKKLQKWRRKQKTNKKSRNDDGSSVAMQVDKPYSEIADYGYGRRSIDIDPRYSLDAGRMSFDDPRCSWDAPRASWDGHLTGRSFSRFPPPMVSLVENLPVSVPRFDTQIPVEEPRISVTEDATTPGGSAQTRDYYSSGSPSSQKPRKSFERSNSIRKKAPAVVADVDDANLASPATLHPFTTPKLLVTDADLRSLKSTSLRDDCSKRFESAFLYADSVTSALEQKGSKKSHRWSKAWSIWGLMIRRSGSKDDEEETYSRRSMVERSLSESWPEFRRHPNGALNRVLHNNSSVSSRSSFGMSRSFSSTRRNAAKANGHGKKKREEHVLEKNRSARYSSNDVDNGLLRFYLAPMRNGRRNGSAKSMPKNSHSSANNVTRLY